MIEERVYVCIEYALVEQLRGEAKKVAELNGIKDGLVAIKTFYNNQSRPSVEFEVVPVKGSPTEYLRGLAKAEGIDKIVKKLRQNT